MKITKEYVEGVLNGQIPSYIKSPNLIEIKSDLVIADDILIEGQVIESEIVDMNSLNFVKKTNLSFKNCKFKKLMLGYLQNARSIDFIDTEISELCIYGKMNRVSIKGGYIGDLQVTSQKLLVFVLDGNLDKTFDRIDLNSNNIWNIDIDNLKVKELTLSKTSSESRSINLKNVYVNNLRLLRFEPRTDDYVTFKDINPLFIRKSIIRVENSKPEKLHFSNCDFKAFKQLEVKDSWFDNITSENTTWFEKIVKLGTDTEDTFTYRLLKSAMQRQHDFPSELYFRSKELNSYLDALPFRNNKSEWILLKLNQISNNHGIDWWRGFKFTSIIAVILFSSYLLSLEDYPYRFGWENWQILKNAISEYIKYFSQFFIITHPFDFMSKFNPTGTSFFVDLLSRIFISYGIYQTIQAFRKFGK